MEKKTKINWIIVRGDTVQEIENKVNSALAEGWQLQDPLAVRGRQYYQTMVKYIVTDKEKAE